MSIDELNREILYQKFMQLDPSGSIISSIDPSFQDWRLAQLLAIGGPLPISGNEVKPAAAVPSWYNKGKNAIETRETTTLAERPALNKTDKKAAQYIRKNPGCKGESLALAISVTAEHFRSRIFPKLRKHGFANNGGYRPPKRTT